MHGLARISLTLFLFSSMFHNHGAASEAVDLGRILGNHFAAIGGAENIAALENLKLRLRIREPEFEVEGLYRASADGRMRIDIFAGEQRVFSEGIDERGGWQQNGEGTAVLSISAEGLLALERGIERNLTGLMAYSAQGDNVKLLDRRELAGTDFYVVETIEQDGSARQHFIHPQSWLVERSRETKALHPDVNSTEVSTEERHTLFKPLCGVMRSYMSESYDLSTEGLIQTTEILEASCNVDDVELDLARPQGD